MIGLCFPYIITSKLMLVYINHINVLNYFCISYAEILITYSDILKNSELAMCVFGL